MADRLLLSFYGDDFTGSTDSMEALSLAGVRTALFLEPPQAEELRGAFADLQAVGVAGVTRSLATAQLEAVLSRDFARMKRLNATVFHYKICSTFDSSPEVGSIGRAVEVGQEVFASPFVPLVVGAPILKRYCLFGNLFATVGQETFRLDRHPTMREHPVTPMRESDLRVHLALQTDKRIALIDILHLTGAPGDVDRNLTAALRSRPDVVLFDVLDDFRLGAVGRLMWERAKKEPLFAVGSSGVEYALTKHWKSVGILPPPSPPAPPVEVEQMLIVSGSCSPITERQIRWAVERGYTGLAVDAAQLLDAAHGAKAREDIIRRALDILGTGQSLVLYSALGPRDSSIGKVTQLFAAPHIGARLGEQLGQILDALLERTALRRVVVAGGDTSGYVIRQLGIYALEMVAPVAPGSPLCRAHSRRPQFNALELALKGGQVGREDYFERVRLGGSDK